jgi:hypothetical protein
MAMTRGSPIPIGKKESRSQSEQQSDKTAPETDRNVEPDGSEGKEKIMADITYSTSEDGTEVIFKADTPEGWSI